MLAEYQALTTAMDMNTEDARRAFCCNCGATTEGKWADVHAPSCPAVAVVQEIEELIRANCRAVEGWPITIEGIENAAAAIYAKFAATTR